MKIFLALDNDEQPVRQGGRFSNEESDRSMENLFSILFNVPPLYIATGKGDERVVIREPRLNIYANFTVDKLHNAFTCKNLFKISAFQKILYIIQMFIMIQFLNLILITIVINYR